MTLNYADYLPDVEEADKLEAILAPLKGISLPTAGTVVMAVSLASADMLSEGLITEDTVTELARRSAIHSIGLGMADAKSKETSQ